MIELRVDEILQATGGVLLGNKELPATIPGPVEFDSRKCSAGSIYVALPGARVDGHDFVESAIEQGAVLALVAQECYSTSGELLPSILVPEIETTHSNSLALEYDAEGKGARVLAALSALARYSIERLEKEHQLTVIGVTGSAGKTSTKDLIASILSSQGETVAPPGSFNNEIGHPYTALKAGSTTRYLVAEMSARGVGHIRHLATIAPPHIGVVLNVGTAHIGEFGSQDNIAQAKGELVEAVPIGGRVILNADDPQVLAMASRTEAQVIYFSAKKKSEGFFSASDAPTIDYWASDIQLDDQARPSFSFHYPGGKKRISLKVHGEHQVSNALAALGVGMTLIDHDEETLFAALEGHKAVSSYRMDVQRRSDGLTVINDSYNANPESMRAGIDALASMKEEGSYTWAVLGQMGELGEGSQEEHERVAEYLRDKGIDHLVVVGNGVNQHALAVHADECGIHTEKAETIDAAVNLVDQQAQATDKVLVKASKSDELWLVAEGLLAERP